MLFFYTLKEYNGGYGMVRNTLRMEVACFLISVFIAVLYFLPKREKTRLHKYFSYALISLMVYLVFDGITVYTVNNLHTVPLILNDIMHRIYLTMMLLTLYFLYRYISQLIYEEKNSETGKLENYIKKAYDIFTVIAEIVLLVTPVTYVETPKGNYEHGIGAYTIYVVVAFFMLHMIINTFIHIKQINPKNLLAIIASFTIEITIAVITLIDFTFLLAGLGLTLMVVAIYLTIENPDIKLLEQVKEEKQKAEEANASKSKFLSVVSHEIRTPMNAIVGMTEILLNDDLDEKQRKYLTNIKSSSKSLVLILNDILDISKIEAGKMQIIEQPYKLPPVLDDVRMIIENRIGNKPIKLIYDIDEKIPDMLYGDGLRIRQILINLLNNSVKFTDSGEIRLTIKQLSADSKNMSLKFQVNDTGQGIKEDDLSKLFKAFSQVDQKKNYGKEGTGMGLSISSELISLMGGHIEVASKYGKWTEFNFTINQGFVNEESVSESNKTLNLIKGFRVLVVDDSIINLEIAKEIFEMLDVQADIAESGEEALKMICENSYNVIFTDYIMPVMNGVELTIKIREMSGDYFKKVPVIAFTGDTSEETKNEFKRAGINDFMEKPIDVDKLCKITEKWSNKLKEHINNTV